MSILNDKFNFGSGRTVGQFFSRTKPRPLAAVYFYENGDFSDEYDLLIEKTGDFYSVSWISNGKIVAKAVGMETESGLAVGWRQIKD